MDILIYLLSAIVTILILIWVYSINKYQKKQYLVIKEMALLNGVDVDTIEKIDNREEWARKKRLN